MVFWLPTHGISNPLLSYVQVVSHLQLLWNIDPFPLYIVPTTHGISDPLPIAFRTPSVVFYPPPFFPLHMEQ